MKTLSVKSQGINNPKIFSDVRLTIRTEDDYDIVVKNKEAFNDFFVPIYGNSLTFFEFIKSHLAITTDSYSGNCYYFEVKISSYNTFKSIAEKYTNIYFKLFGTYPKIITKVESDTFEGLFFKSEILLIDLLRLWNIGLIELNYTIKEVKSNENIYQKNIQLLNEMSDILNCKNNNHWTKNMSFINDKISEKEEFKRIINIDNLLNNLNDFPSEDLFDLPIEPLSTDINFDFFTKVFTSNNRKEEIIEEQLNSLRNSWNIDYQNKQKKNIEIERLNSENYNVYKSYREYIKSEIINLETKFEKNKEIIKSVIEDYNNNNNIESYFHYIISNSIIKKYCNIDVDIQYLLESKILVVDFSLPMISVIPKTKDFKYLKTKDEFVEKEYTSKELNNIYNDFIYKIVFRILSDICNSDSNSIIETISFNGWVNSVNPKNGNFENKCILTLSAKKKSILDINIEQIVPIDAFRALKGISAVQLSEYTAIAPILNINKEDKRFVQSENVLKNISSTTNIAAIGWEEFEHLIRELFEKEFEANGGEVRVTQTSRDGGVDAVAFDPDPIRGGKIVIQSKRYTNVVGVSSVRDLYGTVMNEGATKGILVTTSYYGSDAYEFAKDKPLTLIDGSGLLSLLQKHSFNARIDLNEAKIINKEIKN